MFPAPRTPFPTRPLAPRLVKKIPFAAVPEAPRGRPARSPVRPPSLLPREIARALAAGGSPEPATPGDEERGLLGRRATGNPEAGPAPLTVVEARALGLPRSGEARALDLYRSCLSSGKGPSGGARNLDGERLRYLGEAVLGLVATRDLISGRGPPLTPCRMHEARAGALANRRLADHARAAGVDDLVARHRASSARNPPSGPPPRPSDKALADAAEALAGAVFLVEGLPAAADWARSRLGL